MSISFSSRNGVSRSSMKNTGMQASPSANATGTRSDEQRDEHAEQDQRDLKRAHDGPCGTARRRPRSSRPGKRTKAKPAIGQAT